MRRPRYSRYQQHRLRSCSYSPSLLPIDLRLGVLPSLRSIGFRPASMSLVTYSLKMQGKGELATFRARIDRLPGIQNQFLPMCATRIYCFMPSSIPRVRSGSCTNLILDHPSPKGCPNHVLRTYGPSQQLRNLPTPAFHRIPGARHRRKNGLGLPLLDFGRIGGTRVAL